MICQCCGIEAPTKYVSFHQNIGALVMRFSKSIDGNLCKSCIHSNFWKMTGTTLFLGWWGTISFIITPFLILNNVFRYLIALPMPAVPPGARTPSLSRDERKRISPYLEEMFDRLNQDDAEFSEIATEYSEKIGVTPGQIALAIHEAAEAAEGPR